MATITGTQLTSGAKAVTETTLTGTADIFAFTRGSMPALLILRNDTAGSLSPVIDGDEATTVTVAGVGSVDISSGFAVGAIGAGEVVAISLNTIHEYLVGEISITGGTGLVAQLLTF